MIDKIEHSSSIIKFIDEAPKVEGKSIIDYGCGKGVASISMVERGATKVIAVGSSSDEERIRRTLEEQEDKIKDKVFFKRYEAANLILDKHDLVWTHNILQNQYDPVKLLSELRGFLKEDGQIWITVPNFDGIPLWRPGQMVNYNAPLLVEHLRMAGFDVANIKSWRELGILRVMVGNSIHKSDYPPPILESLELIGKCPNEVIENYQWGDKIMAKIVAARKERRESEAVERDKKGKKKRRVKRRKMKKPNQINV